MIQRIKNKLNRLGTNKTCYICRNNFSYFLPYRDGKRSSGFIRDLEIIGSDTENFSCPHCFSHDRERHLFMYMDALSIWDSCKGHVLHFAPETHLSKKIESLQPEKYVKADLYSEDKAVEKIDITAIPYSDDSFDLLICNHVLEHIDEIDMALSEIYRVLNKGGMAILQTPYSSILANSFQDKNINTDNLRQNFYGQEDHVRVFGHDLFNKLENIGFKLKIKKHEDVLHTLDSTKLGVNSSENLILVEK